MTSYQIKRNRSKVKLNYALPVVIVSRSNKNIQAQILEPLTKKTLFTANSYKETGTKTEKSTIVGKLISAKLKELKFDRVLFDRNGYVFKGARINSVANAIIESGITI
jgi:large subunit ribosomal protein L18